jgi:hypothetical protein
VHILRLFLFACGCIFLLGLIALGRQLAARHLQTGQRSKTLRGSVEGWLLFAAMIVLLGRFIGELVGGHMLASIRSVWLLGYGICCAVYLAIKALRVFFLHG